MRFKASHSPLMAPWRDMASMAYWLHVGVKRHTGGNSGEMAHW